MFDEPDPAAGARVGWHLRILRNQPCFVIMVTV